jgi:hypothetical protein
MNATTRATFDKLRGRFVKANPGRDPLTPPAQGLYDPSKEHDSCGVGFVADMKNRKSHDILEKGLQLLINLDHRGAVGADPSLGDGCGVLTQILHAFFASECAKQLRLASRRTTRSVSFHAAAKRGLQAGASDRRSRGGRGPERWAGASAGRQFRAWQRVKAVSQ